MAEFNPAASQIEWHMQQLRQWMVPTSVPASHKTSPVAPIHAFPQDYYVQNVPPSDLYDFDVFNDVGPSVNALQRSHTFNNLNDYHFNHDPFQVHHNPMTIANYFGEETGNTDDVVSIYSDAPSSYLSSDLSDQPRVDTHLSPSRNTPPVFQQPFSLAGSAPESTSEVDSLMKTLRPLTSHPQAESAVKNKRHVCPYSECGKLFSQPTHLKIHLRSHTGEKPYTCSFAACRQAFSQLGNLRTHERRHVGQRPNRRRTSSDPGQRPKRYECRLDGCKATNEDGNQGKVFTQLGNLKAHMNKFHKETLARLSEQFAMSTDDEEEQELRRYFQDLYKHSNKGIKGRGKGRKVEVIMPSDQG